MVISGRPDKAEINRLAEAAAEVDARALLALWDMGKFPAAQKAESELARIAGKNAENGDLDIDSNVSVDGSNIDFRGYVFGVYDRMKSALSSAEGDRITVRIDSPGGSMWEGAAVYNLLRQSERPVDTFAMGKAFSAASVIFAAGDTRTVGGGAHVMIHDASTIAMGNADQMRDMARALDQASNGMAELYAARAGGTPADWRARMSYDNFLTGSEAVRLGLATDHDGSAKDDPEPEPEPQSDPEPTAGPPPKASSASHIVVCTPFGFAKIRTE